MCHMDTWERECVMDIVMEGTHQNADRAECLGACVYMCIMFMCVCVYLI